MPENMFERYAADRKTEQRKIERAVVPEERDEDERRTTLSLALSVGDKKKLKMRSMQEGKTIAAIVHEWIASWDEEASE